MGDCKRRSPKKALPKFSVSLNAGYGWRIVNMDGITGTERDFYNDLNKGLAYEASCAYYFNTGFGMGLTYSGLTTGTGNKYNVKGDSQFKHYLIDFIGRNVYWSDKWVPEFRLGIGYADYQIELEDYSNRAKEWGGTLGLHYSFGIDYVLSEH
ncbi:hypothetical protein LJB91_01970 [Bacteroidales bacterium OttesenSCG-928-L03]|nr:hypothetical protein [Bacteroidales bacterium OttesenSCG-928-L03]